MAAMSIILITGIQAAGKTTDTSGLTVAETAAGIRAHLETTARIGIDQEDA